MFEPSKRIDVELYFGCVVARLVCVGVPFCDVWNESLAEHYLTISHW